MEKDSFQKLKEQCLMYSGRNKDFISSQKIFGNMKTKVVE